MSLTVRRVDAGDEAAWRDLWTRYLGFYETTRPEAIYARTFARILDPVIAMHGAFALRDGVPVGLVHWLYHMTFWDEPMRVYLQDLYVAEAARGTGAGRALIQTVYADADAHGTADVYWLTAEDNHPAQALYDRVAVRTPFVKYRR